MTSEVIPMKASDQLNRMGLPPEVLLHATLLCNNLRLSATAEELSAVSSRVQSYRAKSKEKEHG